jgi:hypothetical protein
MSIENKICLVCGKTFFKPLNESEKCWLNRHKYCSKKCKDKAPRSKKTREKMRLKKIGKSTWNKGLSPSEITRKKISDKLKGKRLPMSTRLKMMGRKPWNWKGGITKIHEKIRQSVEGRLWKNSVFERDNFACIWCGSTERIEADHIKPFAYYPELRFAIDNGRTLCHKCHKTTDTYGVRN